MGDAMRDTISTPIRLGAVLAAISFVVVSLIAVAQDREAEEAQIPETEQTGLPATSWAVTPQQWASALFNSYDLVALGRFEGIPDWITGEKEALTSQIVTVAFTVAQVFKGSVEPNTAVAVNVSSDMLIYPGEQVSRYAWRNNRQLERANAWLETLDEIASLERRFEAGALSAEQYEQERVRLERSQEDQLASSSGAPIRMHVTAHSTQSFYSLGGAIAAGNTYLIGISKTSDVGETFVLVEEPSDGWRNIFWGQMADDVAEALAGAVSEQAR